MGRLNLEGVDVAAEELAVRAEQLIDGVHTIGDYYLDCTIEDICRDYINHCPSDHPDIDDIAGHLADCYLQDIKYDDMHDGGMFFV